MFGQSHPTKKQEKLSQKWKFQTTTTLSIYKMKINHQVFSARLMQFTTQKRCVSYTKWQLGSKSTPWNKMLMTTLLNAQYVVKRLTTIASMIWLTFALSTTKRSTICRTGSLGITSEWKHSTNQVTLDFVMNIRRCMSSTQTRIRRHIVVSVSWSTSRVAAIKIIRYR